jgi:hypothetical protein
MQIEQVRNGEVYSDTGRNQNEVSAMQELLTTLTEQKLCFTMEVSVGNNTDFKHNLYN